MCEGVASVGVGGCQEKHLCPRHHLVLLLSLSFSGVVLKGSAQPGWAWRGLGLSLTSLWWPLCAPHRTGGRGTDWLGWGWGSSPSKGRRKLWEEGGAALDPASLRHRVGGAETLWALPCTHRFCVGWAPSYGLLRPPGSWRPVPQACLSSFRTGTPKGSSGLCCLQCPVTW